MGSYLIFLVIGLIAFAGAMSSLSKNMGDGFKPNKEDTGRNSIPNTSINNINLGQSLQKAERFAIILTAARNLRGNSGATGLINITSLILPPSFQNTENFQIFIDASQEIYVWTPNEALTGEETLGALKLNSLPGNNLGGVFTNTGAIKFINGTLKPIPAEVSGYTIGGLIGFSH